MKTLLPLAVAILVMASTFNPKLRKTQAATTTTAMPGGQEFSEVSCNAREFRFGDFSYRSFGKIKNFTAAEEHCVANGGHLASIHSAEENKFVCSLRVGRFYIGLNDKAAEGTFGWTDGSPLDFSQWLDGELDNFRGVEDCVEVNWQVEGTWNDLNCAIERPFVCKRRVAPRDEKLKKCLYKGMPGVEATLVPFVSETLSPEEDLLRCAVMCCAEHPRCSSYNLINNGVAGVRCELFDRRANKAETRSNSKNFIYYHQAD